MDKMGTLSMLVSISSKPTFEQWSLFQCRGNHVSKGATIKEKNLGRVFFSLKVAPMRIQSNFKGHWIEKLPKLNYANMSVFKNGLILMPQILNVLQYSLLWVFSECLLFYNEENLILLLWVFSECLLFYNEENLILLLWVFSECLLFYNEENLILWIKHKKYLCRR